MSWIFFVVGAVLSWGLYGPVLHKGQLAPGHPLTASTLAGVLGALGAVCVIYAFRSGGSPLWVMHLVFRGRSPRQRPLLDVNAPAEDGAEPDALPGLRTGRRGGVPRAALQAAGLKSRPPTAWAR